MKIISNNAVLMQLVPQYRARIENLFITILRSQTPAPILQQAMAHTVCSGGKYIRSLLVYITGLAFNVDMAALDPAAVAVEFIHSYSLIHDDLPAMDNADLRRGQPCCHKIYGEAMAILAGDALQTLALEVILENDQALSAQQRCAMLKIISRASGLQGMAAGQALDMSLTPITLDNLLTLYRLKTGALFSASIKLGRVCANIIDSASEKALEKYADCLGLAFQLQDDLFDIECCPEALGKLSGVDKANNKITYPVLMGLEKTREKIFDLHQEALAAIAGLSNLINTNLFAELAAYLLQRKQ